MLEESNEQLANRAGHSLEWQSAAMHAGVRVQREDSIDLSQLWGMVRDNARLVFAIAGVVFVAVMAFCLSSRMMFTSVGRLYLGELEGKVPASGNNIEISASTSSEASSEIEVLRSRSMVRRAVLASGLNVTIAPPGWKSPRFWKWLVSSRDPNLLDVTFNKLNAADTALADEVVGSRIYRLKFLTETEFMLSSGNNPAVAGKLGTPLKTPEATIALVPGRDAIAPGTEYDVRIAPLDEVVESVLAQLTVVVPKASSGSESSRVLLLEFASPTRRVAASFLEHLMRGYLDARHAWKTEDASAAEQFVTDQLRAMQQSLDRTQQKMAEYRADNRVVVLAGEAESMVQQANRFEEQRLAAMLQVTSLRNIKRALKNPGLPLETYMVGEANDPVLQQLATQLSQDRARFNDLDGQFNAASPDLKRQRAQMNDQTVAIRNYVDARLARAEQSVSALAQVINELETKLKTVPNAELRMAQIGRESEVYSRMYSYLLERQQQAAITKASTVSKNRILDAPQLPLREDSPKLMLHLASGILGLLFGAAFVILRGLFSGVFRRENDVRVVLGPIQVFARLPTRLARLRGKNPDAAWPVPPVFDVMAPQADVGYAEALRSLRTNLYRALPGEHGKVVLVTSPSLGDGKTTCALSLAAMLAADNRRVLVIDADVRKPTHHTILGVPPKPGLRDVVSRNSGAWKSATRTMCLSVGWFDSICTEAGASAELLSDGLFARFLVDARAHYDFIVVDSASYPLVSDPLVLAPVSDFVLSVFRLGSTQRKPAEEHLSAIFTVARGCAVVVNGVEIPTAFATPNQPQRAFGAAFRRLQ